MTGLSRVTIVEDDADIRDIAEFALADIGGLEVQLCASGRQAIATAADFAPDLILLDLMMPGMDGIETFARLKAISALAATPTIFMTARSGERELDRLMALGAAGIVAKPFDPMSLADEVRTIWQAATEAAA
jgi:CheY-like chemotaxis protein